MMGRAAGGLQANERRFRGTTFDGQASRKLFTGPGGELRESNKI